MDNILTTLPKIADRKKKRLGRGLGSGRGAKSGRGTTRHQKARESIPLSFEGGQGRMVKRFPLLRGKGINKPKRQAEAIINIKDLDKLDNNSVVDLKFLLEKGLITKDAVKKGVKILGGEKLEKKLTIKLPVSAKAKLAIESAGGKVEI